MSIFTVERSGFTDCQALVNQLLTDLAAHGFTVKFPISGTINQTDFKATLEVSSTVDSVTDQPWRIRIEALDASKIQINVATSNQLLNDGSYSMLDDNIEYAGHVGVKTSNSASTYYFVNRSNLSANELGSYPMSYRLMTCTHGLALFIWEPGSDNVVNNFSWVAIQRSVNNANGTVRTTGKSPVYCVYGINHKSLGSGETTASPNVNIMHSFIVRESDVVKPTIGHDITVDSSDVTRLINIEQQVAITEDNNYVINFPNGLNTQRYAYPTDELDLIGYTSADVIASGSAIQLTMYGETNHRVYRAMMANQTNNSGMRLLMLEDGGDSL